MSTPLITNPCTFGLNAKLIYSYSDDPSAFEELRSWVNAQNFDDLAWGYALLQGAEPRPLAETENSGYASFLVSAPSGGFCTVGACQISLQANSDSCAPAYMIFLRDSTITPDTIYGCTSSMAQQCLVIDLPVPENYNGSTTPNLAMLLGLVGANSVSSVPNHATDLNVFAQIASDLTGYGQGVAWSGFGPDWDVTQICGGADANPFE